MGEETPAAGGLSPEPGRLLTPTFPTRGDSYGETSTTHFGPFYFLFPALV